MSDRYNQGRGKDGEVEEKWQLEMYTGEVCFSYMTETQS